MSGKGSQTIPVGQVKPHKEGFPEEVKSQLRSRVGTSQKGKARQSQSAKHQGPEAKGRG